MQPFAQLPDTAYLVIVCVVVAIIGLVGLGVILSFVRDLRTNLAEELRREITAGKEAAPVSVQQPLEVKEHITYATTDAVQALKDDVDQLRNEVRDGFDKLGNERRTSVAHLHAKVDSANTKVDNLAGKVELMNQQLSQVLSKMLK